MLTSRLPPLTDFATQPQSVVALLGQKVQIDCVYDLSTPVYWKKGEATIVGDDQSFTTFSNGTLQLNSVTEADKDTYTCVAQVGFVDNPSCSGDLTLRQAGEFTRTIITTKAWSVTIVVVEHTSTKQLARLRTVRLYVVSQTVFIDAALQGARIYV